MAKRKKPNGKSGQAIRQYRSQVAALKKAGLVSPKIDARSHKPTRYMLGQIERYRNVLNGTATSVRVPSAALAREYSELYPTKFNRVVIRSQDGDFARWDAERDALVIRRATNLPYGIKSMSQILEPREFGTLPRLPRDTTTKRYFYAIPFKRGKDIQRIYVDTIREIKRYMFAYEKTGFANWQNYVEIFEGEIDPTTVNLDTDNGTKASIRGKSTNPSRKAKTQPRDERGRFTKRPEANRKATKPRKSKSKS